jgi:hypothetical protein
MKGKKLSAAHCAKISEARKGKKRSAGDMCQNEQGKEGRQNEQQRRARSVKPVLLIDLFIHMPTFKQLLPV